METTPHKYTGHFYFMGIDFEVRSRDGGLVAAMPGVPPGFEIRLEPAGEHVFRMHGGPLDGAEAHFHISEAGIATQVSAGGFDLQRVTEEELADLMIVERMQAPAFEPTPEKVAAFQQLYETILEKNDGSEVDYQLPYPKHEFVQYLIDQDDFIFHGSGNQDITQFEPIRTSVELYDKDGRGNLQAVYGTHDGLWSMFFAIVDRGRLNGSIRNGVTYFYNQAGERLALYNFSINQDQLEERPYREGMLYFLPRETFERLTFGGVALANEWASEQPVLPAGKMRIAPEDFPFEITGHDDGPIVRLEGMTDRILGAVQSVESIAGDHLKLEMAPGTDLSELLPEYVALMATFMPGMEFTYEHGPVATLDIDKIPPAYQQVLSNRLK